MRRLPIFLLVDVSESMVGDPINNVNEGIHRIVTTLRGNPMALETAFISIISFAGRAKTVVPLTELLSFNSPVLSIGGGTALGSAMNYLMDEIENQVRKTTFEQKGDWKPIVFLFTDGSPTDDIASAVDRWTNEFRKGVNLVAISIGARADLGVLRRFTDKVLVFNDTEPKAYQEFFDWISASIEKRSINVGFSGESEFAVPPPDLPCLSKMDTSGSNFTPDERHVILLCRCQKNKKPYLMKFAKNSPDGLVPEGAYTISEDYFELTGEEHCAASINTSCFPNMLPCPECGNGRLGHCLCGNLLCLGSEKQASCPWCEKDIVFGKSSSFEINKTQG